MLSYLPLEHTGECLCKGSPMKAMFCMTGHMLECHYPLECQAAGCSHLIKYDFTLDQAQELSKAADNLLSQLADDDCEKCAGTAVMRVPASKVYGQILEGFEDSEVQAVCDCVRVNLVETVLQLGAIVADVENTS